MHIRDVAAGCFADRMRPSRRLKPPYKMGNRDVNTESVLSPDPSPPPPSSVPGVCQDFAQQWGVTAQRGPTAYGRELQQ